LRGCGLILPHFGRNLPCSSGTGANPGPTPWQSRQADVAEEFGTGGADTLGSAGAETLSAQPGEETLVKSDSSALLSDATVYRAVVGGSGDDWLYGSSRADEIYGGGGNDTLTGGAAGDVLYGGTGTDTADYTRAGGAVAASLASGTGSAGDAWGDRFSSIENLTGSAYDDTLTGDDRANLLIGGAGQDSLMGGAGDDTLRGGDGADVLDGGSGMDYADYSGSTAGVCVNLATGEASGGEAEGDKLAGIDGIHGSAHDDELIGFDPQGLSGDVYTNVFYGGAGADYLDGAGGNDVLYGGADDDKVLGGSGDDRLFGDAGQDFLAGDDGDDALDGGAGDDALQGDFGADTLIGGQGSDTLYGGIGDVIDGSEDAPDGRETDVLDLRGSGRFKISYDPDNRENGWVQYYDADGNPTGTLSFSNIESVVTCFTPGTLIVTAQGECPVETLQPGDLVLTRDHGLQALRWVGLRHLGLADLIAAPALQPVCISAGALGAGLPERDLLLSPQHRMLMTGSRAELMFGEGEVLVRARHLCALPGVAPQRLTEVTYIHILFDCHELVLANGAWSESFQPGPRGLAGMQDDIRAELFTLFPELQDDPAPASHQSARLTLKSHEARVLLAQPA